MNSGEPSKQQRTVWWNALTAVSVVALLGVAVGTAWLLFLVLGFLKPVVTPLVVAAILAYLLDPLVNGLVRLRLRRIPAVVLIFCLFGLFLLVSVGVLVPKVIAESQRLAENWDRYVAAFSGTVMGWYSSVGGSLEEYPQLQEYVDSAVNWVKSQAPRWGAVAGQYVLSGAQSLAGSFAFLLGMLLVPVYLFYFLIERERIDRNWRSHVPLRKEWFRDEVVHILTAINYYLVTFFRGQVLVAMIVGVLTAVGLMIIGLDFALLFGLAAGVLGLIPFLGIVLSIVPAMIVGYIQEPGLTMPLLVVAVFVVVQNLEGLFITPKIMGDRTGLHPILVIVGVLFWVQVLGGLFGALLAVPLTATCRVLVARYMGLRLEGMPQTVLDRASETEQESEPQGTVAGRVEAPPSP